MSSIAGLLLAAAFGSAAVAKAVGYRRWRAALDGYALPGALSHAAAPLVPIVELALVAALVAGPRRPAAAASLILLTSFTLIAAWRARVSGSDRLPCGCWGGRRATSITALIWRNAALAALAVVAVTGRGASPDLHMPRGEELVPFALVVLGAAAGVWTAIAVKATIGGQD